MTKEMYEDLLQRNKLQINEYWELINEQDKHIDELQSQLTEKDKQIEELKKQLEENQDLATVAYMQGASRKQKQLEAQIEKMKRCSNCKHWKDEGWYGVCQLEQIDCTEYKHWQLKE